MSGSPFEDIEEDDTLARILDRSEDVSALIEEAKEWWRYDLVRRRVGAAYEECDVGLDLAAFMLSLAERRAVINIPTYSRRRARSTKEGETVLSAKNRHGKIIGVTANKSVFSFSAKIQDVNVVSMETVGEPRNFMMVDVDGTWYEGWKTIELLPKVEENAFLHERSQGEESGGTPWEDSKVDFDHFIDKKRWRMFYGRHYFLTMALIARLYDEAGFYKQLAKDLQARGVKPPAREGTAKSYHHESHEELESIEVDAFEAQVCLLPFQGDYNPPELETDEELLLEALARSRKHIYKDIPWFRWSTRATEYAFHFYANAGAADEDKDDKGSDAAPIKKKPEWAKSVDWQEGFTLPRKRIRWNRFELAPDISLRYRVWPKTEKVKPSEVERRAATTDSEVETSAREETSDGEEADNTGDGGVRGRKRSPARTTRGARRKRTKPSRGSETGDAVEADDAVSAHTTRKRKRGGAAPAKKGWTALGHARSSQQEDSGADEADDDEGEAKESQGENEQHKGTSRKRGKRRGSASDLGDEGEEAEETGGGGIASRTRSRSRTHSRR